MMLPLASVWFNREKSRGQPLLRDKAHLPCLRGNIGLSLLLDMKNYPIKTPQQLGVVLQGYRKARMLTQTQVGARVGLPQKEISKLELDPSNTALARVFKLLAALDLEIVVRERQTSSASSASSESTSSESSEW